MSIFTTISQLISKLSKSVPMRTANQVGPDKNNLIQNSRSKKTIFNPRLPNAKTGSEFANDLMNLTGQLREDLIYQEVISGNIPNFMRNFVEIELSVGSNKIKYSVSPDVLCIGSDEDYIRFPVNALTAQKICDYLNCIMPTRKMGHQIWMAASVKLTPKPNGPPYNNWQETIPALLKNEKAIQEQLANNIVGQLITGHKKDIVITPKLFKYPNNIAIWGWVNPQGQIIQDLNVTSHSNKYLDYSSSVRLINRNVIVNDKETDLFEVLRDPQLSSLVSDEGPFNATSLYKG